MILLILIAGILLLFLIYGYLSNFVLSITKVKIETTKNITSNKICFISDLHGNHFGKNNKRLLNKIDSLNPEFIVMTGDMITKTGKGRTECIALCEYLTKKYKVIYSMGNHEAQIEEMTNIIAILKEKGVNFLDNEKLKVDNNETIYGLSLPLDYYKKFWAKKPLTNEVIENYIGKVDLTSFNILLAHNPEYYEDYEKWGADLCLCGHVHGGIMVLPFVGGVLSPNLRIFPKYSNGLYHGEKSKMFLTRGLGTHHFRFRFFNNPEIVFISLIKNEND